MLIRMTIFLRVDLMMKLVSDLKSFIDLLSCGSRFYPHGDLSVGEA